MGRYAQARQSHEAPVLEWLDADRLELATWSETERKESGLSKILSAMRANLTGKRHREATDKKDTAVEFGTLGWI